MSKLFFIKNLCSLNLRAYLFISKLHYCSQMLKDKVPSASLQVFSQIKYSNIPEFKVKNGRVFFTLQNAKTGKNGFWTIDNKLPKCLNKDDFNARSKLNCYGSSCFDIYPDGLKAISLTGDNLCFFDDKEQVDDVTLPDVDKYVYGEPNIVGEYVYFIRAEDEKQSVVRFKLNDLIENPKPAPQIFDCEQNYFYGNMSFTPNKKYIAYNKWTKGMPFDAAYIIIRNLITMESVSEIKILSGALKYPRWRNDHELYFISDDSGYDRICYFSLKNREWIKTELYRGFEDIGEPNWIVGQQWPMAINEKYLVFADCHFCYCYSFDTKEMRRIEIENITLMHMDEKKHNFVYFKSAGSMVTFIGSLDLSQKQLMIDIVYEMKYLSAESSCVLSTPRLAEFGGIRGYLTVPPDTNHPIPMILWLHGGPTMRLTNALDLRKQCFVAAGFGIFEPAFSGTAGFGRELRDRLYGKWGIQDAQDVIDAANGLLTDQIACKEEIYLIGSSAGAYLALCCIAKAPINTFNAAAVSASFYDAQRLVDEAIPFERDYTIRLLPKEKEDIVQLIVDKEVPIAFFHGSDDPVVKNNDPIFLSAEVKDNGVRTVYKEYEGEGHSIKRADHIVDWIESTFEFFTSE